MVLPRRPLSKRASTASCSMRRSFRMMISGALSSMRRLRRLFRLMTRRYRSLRSEVAKRPPSRGTNGRRSGGSTGMTESIIHSGRLPESRNASMTLSRLASFLRFASLVASLRSKRSCSAIACTSRSRSISRTASPPMRASNASSPYSSSMSWNRSSVRISPRSSGVSLGSSTT